MNFFNFGKNKPIVAEPLVEEIQVEEPTLEEQIVGKISLLEGKDAYEIKSEPLIELFDLVETEVKSTQELIYLEKFFYFIHQKDVYYQIRSSLENRIKELISNVASNDNNLESLYKILLNKYFAIIWDEFIDMSKNINNYMLLVDFMLEIKRYALVDNKVTHELSLKALTKEISENNISNLKKYCDKYTLYEDDRVIYFFISCAKQTHDFDFVIKRYNYRYTEVTDSIISSSQETKNYRYVIEALNNVYTEKSKIKLVKHLLAKGKKTEVIKFIDKTSPGVALVPLFKYCISDDNESNLKDMIKHFKKYNGYNGYLKSVDKEKISKILIELNREESDMGNFVIMLYLEADTLLEDYHEVNFSQNPEVDICLKSRGSSYAKFYTSINKVIKSGKTTLALYILNEHGGYDLESDAKLWVDSYVETFVMLDRVDILAKYYTDFVITSQNIELLQCIAESYIKEKKLQEALIVVEDIVKLEPKYPFIKTAKHEIERQEMIQELSQNDLDVDSINTLKGEDFEKLLMQKFEELGFTVIETPRTGDFGADIIVDTKDETRFVIQCKRFKSKVNLKAVQEVVGALPHYNGDIGIVITNSGFLSSAIKLAQSNDIELWDNLKLMKFLTGDISFSQLNEL
jgi:hypothetical protein